MERAKTVVLIQIANVLADESLAIDNERDRIFEICSHGEHRMTGRKAGDSARRIAPRATQDRWTEHAGDSNGIIHAPSDGTLPQQHRIGDSG